MRAFGDEEPSEQHQSRRDDRGRVHPPPRQQVRILAQHQITDGRADQRARGLEAECGQHQRSATARRRAFGDHQMRGRIIAAEREPHAEQADDQPDEALREHDCHQEQDKQRHLDDEHRLAAELIGQAAQRAGADQDAEQARRADQAMLGRREIELLADQRQGDAGHEDDQALEELARNRQPPNPFLHAGHRRRRRDGAVPPQRRFVDIALHGIGAWPRHGRVSCCDRSSLRDLAKPGTGTVRHS